MRNKRKKVNSPNVKHHSTAQQDTMQLSTFGEPRLTSLNQYQFNIITLM